MRPRGSFTYVLILPALALLLLQVPARRAAAAGVTQLRAHSGEVELRRAKGGPGAPTLAAGPLYRRDEVQTRRGTASIELAGGTGLELGPDTLFAVLGGVGSVDGFLAHGALAVTSPGAGGEPRPIQIATSLGRIDLRVHEARIEAAAGRVLVQVRTGTAEIVVQKQRVALGAGQELELHGGGVITEPRPLSPAPPPAAAAVSPPPELASATPPEAAPARHGPVTPPVPPPAVSPGEAAPSAPHTPGAPPPAHVLAAAPSGAQVPAAAPPPAHVPAAAPPPAHVPAAAPSGAHAPAAAAIGSPPAPALAAPPELALAAPPPALAPVAAPAGVPPKPKKEPFFGFTTLALLREKNIISQAEFDSAQRDLRDSVGPRAADNTTIVLGKWATTLFGFVQGDIMWHSTQSFNDFGSNFPVARPGTYAGDHSRFEGSIRDSRIGVRIQPPELSWMRSSALFELDLLGPTGTIGSTISENSFFVNPNLRVRHAYFKAETPIVDILFGQTWHLFGWQPSYIPAVVQWAGIVGELFSRTTQLRISKTIKTKPVNIEIAVAGMRPPERDSSLPEFEAGLRLVFNKWTAVHTGYMTSTATQAASIAVSGDLRQFTLPEFSVMPQTTNTKMGLGIAVNAFIPIIPRTKERKDNSLSILAEYVTGQGISDLYTGLTGGVVSPPPPGASPTAPAFSAGIDAGLAVYDVNGELQLPRWTTFVVSLEYYLPGVGGRVGLFANVSRSQLHDSSLYANPTRVRDNEIFYNGGFYVDVTDAIRLGFDYARFDDQYADGVHATNDAVQMSGFLFF